MRRWARRARGLSAGLLCALGTLWVTAGPARAGLTPNASYWEITAAGDVYGFGSAPFYGSTSHLSLSRPIVGAAATPDGNGYWFVASDGGVFAFGHAPFLGSMGGLALYKPVVAMAADPATGGYWLVASDGGIFSFGAPFYGSTGGMQLAQPIVSMATTPDGGGYWLVGADGGVFAFGDAGYFGSLPGLPLAARPTSPVVAIASSPDGQGYLEVTTAGDVYNFGDSAFEGSTAGVPLSAPVVDAAQTPGGDGYWLAGRDGGVFAFGDAQYAGSVPDLPASVRTGSPVVAFLPAPLLSGSWSGYTQDGTGITSVSGTFTAPTLTGAQPGQEMAAWVGIDGLENSSLIQAGILEVPVAGGGTPQIEAWWEILPNVEVPIPTVSVAPGDQVTVHIWRVATGLFEISLVDGANGQQFSIVKPYLGPLQSADWIVEAPSLNGTTMPLAPYSPVAFNNVAFSATAVSGVTELILSQGGSNVSVPSALRGGRSFTVTYLTP